VINLLSSFPVASTATSWVMVFPLKWKRMLETLVSRLVEGQGRASRRFRYSRVRRWKKKKKKWTVPDGHRVRRTRRRETRGYHASRFLDVSAYRRVIRTPRPASASVWLTLILTTFRMRLPLTRLWFHTWEQMLIFPLLGYYYSSNIISNISNIDKRVYWKYWSKRERLKIIIPILG